MNPNAAEVHRGGLSRFEWLQLCDDVGRAETTQSPDTPPGDVGTAFLRDGLLLFPIED